ncbi:MAG: ATP-binding cassette domain-containing protein [Kiloniellales bacterium]|nr:ATP-binding cassette domain-containing protein [Kiloniellales bacterium]
MAEALLETRRLSKSFGGVHAVDGVDFRLRSGELRCLIGPNGAGKSTFFKLLTGQLRPSGGTILFEGSAVTGRPIHQIGRLGIGIKNQTPDVLDGVPLRENLWLAARLTHAPVRAGELVEEVIERLSLAELAADLVGELSHGQRQLVEIGMVMAREPKLLLLDEPSAGMSAEERERVAALLKELNQTATLVVVEHDMQFIKQIADLVTVFHQGRVLMEKPIDAVLRDPMVRDVYLGRRAVH